MHRYLTIDKAEKPNNPHEILPTERHTSLIPTPTRQIHPFIFVLPVVAVVGVFLIIWLSVSPVDRLWYSRILLGVLTFAGMAGVVWLVNHARQASIVRDVNNRPLTVAQVARQSDTLIAYGLTRHYDNQDVWAAHSDYRNLNSLSTHYSNRQDTRTEASTTSTDKPTVLPVNPNAPLLAQLEEKGLIPPDKLLVGFADQQPQQFNLKLTGFMGLAGKQGSGKTTTALLALAQAAHHNWRVIICDPHGEQDEGLIKRAASLSGCFIKQAIELDDIIAAIQWYMQLADNRIQKRVPVDTRILLVIDEFTSLVLRKQLPVDLLRDLTAAATAYRKVECHGLIIGHQWSHNTLGKGEAGAALRRALTHTIVHRIAKDDAELLLPPSNYHVETLQPGQAIIDNYGDVQRVTIPQLDDSDMQRASGVHTPPPQISAPASYQASQLAPTVRAASPTAQLQPLTVQEEIINLLTHRSQPVSAREIASHLGKKDNQISNALKGLVDDGTVKRLGSRGSYRYAR